MNGYDVWQMGGWACVGGDGMRKEDGGGSSGASGGDGGNGGNGDGMGRGEPGWVSGWAEIGGSTWMDVGR